MLKPKESSPQSPHSDFSDFNELRPDKGIAKMYSNTLVSCYNIKLSFYFFVGIKHTAINIWYCLFFSCWFFFEEKQMGTLYQRLNYVRINYVIYEHQFLSPSYKRRNEISTPLTSSLTIVCIQLIEVLINSWK